VLREFGSGPLPAAPSRPPPPAIVQFPPTCSRKSRATAVAAHTEKLRTAGIGVSSAPRPNASTSHAAASVMEGPAVPSARPVRTGMGSDGSWEWVGGDGAGGRVGEGRDSTLHNREGRKAGRRDSPPPPPPPPPPHPHTPTRCRSAPPPKTPPAPGARARRRTCCRRRRRGPPWTKPLPLQPPPPPLTPHPRPPGARARGRGQTCCRRRRRGRGRGSPRAR
jgi:hypothetical protein